MRRFLLLSVFALVFYVSFIPNSYAADALQKLGRGAANVTTGWMDVFKEVDKQSDESGALAGATVGAVKGIFKAVGRTLVGAYEMVTFPIPTYKPVIEPEFVWTRGE